VVAKQLPRREDLKVAAPGARQHHRGPQSLASSSTAFGPPWIARRVLLNIDLPSGVAANLPHCPRASVAACVAMCSGRKSGLLITLLNWNAAARS
jgi:hypothetical protein